MSDVPPPPPGFTLDAAPTKRKRSEGVPPPPEGFTLDDPTGEAVDGDTLKMENGGDLRLYGVDAPELRQQGWDRQGQPVAIGDLSRLALDTITSPLAVPGPQQGSSYGRPVAPVTDHGSDLGEQQVRTGNALAAPAYLAADPQRRHDYMRAERLARLNGLGVHDTYHQSPEAFRRDPVASPERETIAQWWDSPTPWAGLRPEDEKAYVDLLQTAKTGDEIVAFIKRAGADMNPADAARWIKARDDWRAKGRDLPGNVIYGKRPPIMTNQGDGAAGASARGIANGVLPNFLEETGAVADMFGATTGRENVFNSDRRWADIWANNATQNEAITRYDAFAYPYVTTGAQIAGGLVLPMGKVDTAADLAKWGAGFGFASGFGREGSIPERLISGTVGAGEGLVTTVVGGKALEAAAPYVDKGLRYVTGKGPRTAPEPPVVASEGLVTPDVPPPPDGFTVDSQRTMAMDAEPGPSVSMELPRQRDDIETSRPQLMDQPISDPQRQAMAETVDPRDVLPIPSNEVGSVDEAARIDAGRFAEVKAPNERAELTRRTVRAWNGSEVPKVGPIDMVGWLRLNGGLADQGGELSHMGLTNAGRKLEFAGQEQRFGPLVSDAGMNLDDAAMRAWEAGYFPDLTDRPTVNEFLDALRSTHEGRARNFLPEDLPEIDAYRAVQAERYAIEQQRFETGQPVMQDRSVPADEPAPFAPPEAYEEWPSGGPDFAGNIRLEKLETPQDIKRALDFTERRVGFDAATRGRVSQAETERLASEMGMTAEQLLSRRKGQALNAEEALAARQILAKSGNELVNLARKVQAMDEPGDDLLAEFRQAWMRQAAIQEQVAGATAEAGRALAQFKMLASSRAVKSDVLSSLVNAGGGRKRLQEAADVLLDTIEVSPDKFAPMVEALSKPRFRDKAVELWINSLLSGPQTHAVNITSNTLTAMAQIPEHIGAALVGKARQAFSRRQLDRVLASEVGARAFGLIQGAKEGARLFAQAIRTGEPADHVSKVEHQGFKSISGIKGEVIRLPTRLLTAEDELFKGVARRMELNGLAVRKAHSEGLKGDEAKARIAELVANPTDEMLAQSMNYARYLTFQSKLGPGASKVSGLTQDQPWLKLFVPFVRTPINLLKFAAERSPAAPLLKEWRNDFKAGGARRDLAIAKAVIGTGMGALVYQLAQDGLITGAGPADQGAKAIKRADGWQPFSVRFGDKYVSYQRLDPFSTTLGIAATLADLGEHMTEKQQERVTTLFVASVLQNLASKTWLSGISSITEAIADPDRYAEGMMERLFGSMAVPTGVAQVARTLDPISREVDGIAEAVRNRIPGLSKALPPRRDVWGQPVENEGGVGPDIVSPLWQSAAKNDPVNKAMLDAGAHIGKPSKSVGDREMTAKEYGTFRERSGGLAKERIGGLIKSDEWKSMSGADRKDKISDVLGDARREVKAEMFGKPAKGGGGSAPATPPPPAGFKAEGIPPPPAGFTVEGEAGGRNVYADLQKAIPGIQFTSGFRDYEYNQKLKARGYHAADNTTHMDGDTLDMLPPPGKSLGWLRAQVKRQYPKAELLVHDGHLHGRFPGYFGAPVLGGAKPAGVRNPFAGMPAPPAGFRLDAR